MSDDLLFARVTAPSNDTALAIACPVCGNDYASGPGCSADACMNTCGDCEPGQCNERCVNPLDYDRGA